MNFCHTKQYLNSAIPYCQRLLNEYFTLLGDQEEQEEEQEEERRPWTGDDIDATYMNYDL